jgi:hypothetical protein
MLCTAHPCPHHPAAQSARRYVGAYPVQLLTAGEIAHRAIKHGLPAAARPVARAGGCSGNDVKEQWSGSMGRLEWLHAPSSIQQTLATFNSSSAAVRRPSGPGIAQLELTRSGPGHNKAAGQAVGREALQGGRLTLGLRLRHQDCGEGNRVERGCKKNASM